MHTNTNAAEREHFGSGDRLLVNANAAARMLSIGERKLWELTNTRALPHVRIGARVLYSPEDLRAWIAGRTKGGTR